MDCISSLPIYREYFYDFLSLCSETFLKRRSLFVQYIQELLVLLKDSGVKAVIIKRYLDIINELVRKYLNVIGYDVLFEFDENFNETISDRRKLDFEYGNLSEGEKLRIDISVMFAFRELSKIRNSISTNILFLDEFTQGTLDIAGFEIVGKC